MNEAALCDLANATLLVFSENVPPFIYYTHVSALILSGLIGLFVYLHDRKGLLNKILFLSLIPFLLWVLFNIIIWASNRSDLIMFLWSLQIMIEPLTYLGMLYLVYVFIRKHDVGLNYKLTAFLIYIPLIAITPTVYSLAAFNRTLCIPVESFPAYYTYVLELLCIVAIGVFAARSYRRETDTVKKNEIRYLAAGVMLYLLAFASGNIFGSFTDDWVNSQFGLFGTPIFAASIAFLIVRYKTFNIKLLGTQALVVALWISLLAILFVRTVEHVRVIVGGTLILFLIIGVLLIRSVKREVKTREELAVANERLKELDQRKTEFLSLASHQLRSPLTAIKGYASLILENSFGPLPDNFKEPVDRIFQSANRLVAIVEDFLTISRIELNKLKYDFAPVDMKKAAETIVAELQPVIENRGLKIELHTEDHPCMARADQGKILQVMTNLVDNAFKYTVSGKIDVYLSCSRQTGKIHFFVKDTGIGMSKKTIDKLFQKFSRGESVSSVNVSGTGLGLYVASQIVEAHHGRLWAESEGEGKGSTFNLELPLA